MGVAKLHNEKFDNSYSLPRIIRMYEYEYEYELGRVHNTHEKEQKCIQNFGHKSFKEDTFFTPGQRWKQNIKMELQ